MSQPRVGARMMSPNQQPHSKLRILVLGYVVRRPLGGGTWPSLQFALGLKRLGHDVTFLEDSEDYPCCYDPCRHVTDADPSFGLRYASKVFDRTGLGNRWAYHDAFRTRWAGPCASKAIEICRTADLLINVSGLNPIRPWMAEIPRRAYVDTNPAFEQARLLTDGHHRRRCLDHNVHFTLGENIPAGSAHVPADGITWLAARQPVVLDWWPVTPGPPKGRFTTVMLWREGPGSACEGFRFGTRAEALEEFFAFPKAVRQRLEIALGSPGAPRPMLRENGWSIINPLVPTEDPWTYQRYIAESRGEFAVAKQGYVVSRCGLFSERSAHYLASGRPVITQDTGFSDWLPATEGLLAYRTPDEARAALDAVDSRYEHHCRMAREIAGEYFDSDRVLSRLLDQAMAVPGHRPRRRTH